MDKNRFIGVLLAFILLSRSRLWLHCNNTNIFLQFCAISLWELNLKHKTEFEQCNNYIFIFVIYYSANEFWRGYISCTMHTKVNFSQEKLTIFHYLLFYDFVSAWKLNDFISTSFILRSNAYLTICILQYCLFAHFRLEVKSFSWKQKSNFMKRQN